MPLPFARPIALADDTHEQLQRLSRAAATPQALAFRCRLILRAAQPDQPTHGQVAAALECNRHTVALWRHRFLDHGLAGLQDAPRPGRPRAFSPLRSASRC
jgi:transposase-like protein